MNNAAHLGLGALLRAFWGRISVTWTLVLGENVLIALVPLAIGWSIDGLLAGRTSELTMLIALLAALGVMAVLRRVYDTRVYGTIRTRLGARVHRRSHGLRVSTTNARLDMARELVDFLEIEAPELITAVIQIVVSLTILTIFDTRLGLTAAAAILVMILFYAFFHRRFYRLNAALNGQKEKQVDIIGKGSGLGVFRHLRALRRSEVALSDTEAFLYGGIFLAQIAFIAANLTIGAGLPGITAGRIFSIAVYSWDFVEAALMLPVTLQTWSRLSEITARINASPTEKNTG